MSDRHLVGIPTKFRLNSLLSFSDGRRIIFSIGNLRARKYLLRRRSQGWPRWCGSPSSSPAGATFEAVSPTRALRGPTAAIWTETRRPVQAIVREAFHGPSGLDVVRIGGTSPPCCSIAQTWHALPCRPGRRPSDTTVETGAMLEAHSSSLGVDPVLRQTRRATQCSDVECPAMPAERQPSDMTIMTVETESGPWASRRQLSAAVNTTGSGF